MVTVQIPRQLRAHVDHQESLVVPGDFLSEAITKLIEHYPSLKPYLMEENGKICGFMNIYINGKDIRFLDKEKTLLNENDIVTLIPAIAGG